MTPQQRAKLRAQKIREAMLPLIQDPRMQVFMDEVKEQQRAAMIDACNERVVANERLSLAALGEVRAYEGLISYYQSQVEQLEAAQEAAATQPTD